MRWNYNDSTRDLFSQGPHRDILIVPHATYVTPVAGGPPIITSKVPQFQWIPVPVYDDTEKKIVMMQKPFPKKDLVTGEVLREDVEWVITNDDIVKEKFKYSYALNSDPNLTFSSCNAAMVQFTIRNKKQYIQELDEQGEPTGNYYWEQEVPNLQNYEFIEKDPNGNSRKIVGELSGNACIKVYTYINGDSSTLMYLGMFNVDEDKAVDNGYNRQITAYDFMAFFRDCDIFYWYKHLWTGINKLDNDFEDYTNDDEEEENTKPDDYDDDVNWVRKPAKDLYPDRDGRWTIGEALTDLFTNFAAYDMITYDEEEVEVEDPDTHEMKKIKKTVAKLGNTVTNPNSYGRNYEEGNGYTGLGMPVMLDPDLFDDTKEYAIPTETGEDVFECYGYMDALDIEFYQDPSVMQSESLSMGKFLEDIGLLAGRYPYIRNDRLQDDDWFDPADCTGNQNRYNNYEKCILTFKPLPTSKDDSKLPTEQMLDNTEISKGFSHESYTVDDIEVVKINFQDKTNIEYSRLTATQRKEKKSGNVQTFTFSDNLFVSYLVEKSDNEEIKKKLENYKALRLKIFGKENKKGNMSSKALFAQGYYNMKYRSYVPYELTTFADPVRDVGDRIKITYTDAVTGEHASFFSYILEREMNGIQKCMDTYRAQGDGLNPVFSNYQTGSKYQSGSSYAASSFGYNAVYSGTGAGGSSGSGALGISPSDLVQYWRNMGIRLLDEPSDCQAVFVKGGESEISNGDIIEYNQLIYFTDPPRTDIYTAKYVLPGYFDNDKTINPIHIYRYDYDTDTEIDEGMYTAKDYDMVCEGMTGSSMAHDYFYKNYMFYQGTWYKIFDETGNHIIADEFENDYVKEGLNNFISTEWNDDLQKEISITHVTSYDVITINGSEVTPNYGDSIEIKEIGYEYENYPIVYMPPGIWNYYDLSASDLDHQGHRVREVPSSIRYHYLGTANLSGSGGITPNIQDGDTQNKIIINGQLVIAEEYDKVLSNNYYFIYYNGEWCNIENRYNVIASLYNTQTTIPEITNIYNDGHSIDRDRLWGLNIDTITIDGVSTKVNIFDAIRLSYYDYITYIPGNVWWDKDFLLGEYNDTIDIRSGTSTIKKYVSLKWSDPQDITDYKPTPATWEGTVIIRKENSAPLHRWDGEKIVRTTTRDKYKTEAYKDEDIEANKVYYYGFFPYYIKIADPEHPIRFYTFTKVIRVETGVITYAPIIESITVNGNDTTIVYLITAPEGVIYSSIKLYGKIGSDPACDDTDDIIEDIDRNETSIVISDLESEIYYFTIQCIDTNEAKVTSNCEIADLSFKWDGSETTILWSGDNNRMTAELIRQGGDPFISFKMYINNNQIYQFDSQYVDTSEVPISRIVKDINIGFLIDENNQIGRPSNIYYNSDQYSSGYQKYIYNASDETPTESEMQDIYVWLQGRAIVPPEYRSYIDTINGTGFFFRDWPQIHDDNWNIDYYPHYPLYIHSYKSYGGSVDFNSGSPWIEETTKGIASLYITEQQTGWGYDTTFEAYDWVYWAVTPDKRTQVGLINKTNQSIGGRSGSSYGWDTDATHTRTDTTGHGYESLSALFYDITRLYRNVNIYVNGELWSKVD